MSKNQRRNQGVVMGIPTGGRREGAGRKPSWFKAKCAELSSSPEFFEFAKRVFKGENVEPRVAMGAIIYTEASVGDKVYLWEKLAGYGYGKPITPFLMDDRSRTPEESRRKAEEVWALIKALEDEAVTGTTVRSNP